MSSAERDMLFDVVADCRVAADTRSKQAREDCKRRIERWKVRYAVKNGEGKTGRLIQDKVIFVDLNLKLAEIHEGISRLAPKGSDEVDTAATREAFETSVEDLARALRTK
jgi:hypothetical protein